MRKKKPAEKPSDWIGEASDAAKHMNMMVKTMNTFTKHTIECFVCLKTDSDCDCTEQSFARYLYERGWRIIESEKLKTIGAACPSCAKKPDDERGE